MVTLNHLRTTRMLSLSLFLSLVLYYHSNFLFNFWKCSCVCYWYWSRFSSPLIPICTNTHNLCLHFGLDLLRLNKGHCCHLLYGFLNVLLFLLALHRASCLYWNWNTNDSQARHIIVVSINKNIQNKTINSGCLTFELFNLFQFKRFQWESFLSFGWWFLEWKIHLKWLHFWLKSIISGENGIIFEAFLYTYLIIFIPFFVDFRRKVKNNRRFQLKWPK